MYQVLGWTMRHIWAFVCLAGALSAAQSAAWAAPRAFQLLDGQVVVTIIIKDRELPALLDTGATESLIDKDLADELGIRSRQTGRTYGASGRKTPFGRTQDVMIDIGGDRRAGAWERIRSAMHSPPRAYAY